MANSADLSFKASLHTLEIHQKMKTNSPIPFLVKKINTLLPKTQQRIKKDFLKSSTLSV